MTNKDLGGASEGNVEAVSPAAAQQMSKHERLRRWAADLELRGAQPLALVDDAPNGAWCSARADGSPLSVAFDDWAFQAEGLQGDRVEDALTFFGMSEDEMRRIVGALDHGQTIPAAVVAARVRALAEQAGSPARPHVGVLIAGASAAAVLGMALLAS